MLVDGNTNNARMIVDGHEQKLPAGALHGIAPITGHTMVHAFDAPELFGVDVDQISGMSMFVAKHRLGGLHISKAGQASSSQDASHGALGYTHAAAIRAWMSLRRHSSTIANALTGEITRRLRRGREERSSNPASPSARYRPTHLGVVGRLTPYAATAAHVASLPSMMSLTSSIRRAKVNRAFLWMFIRLSS